MKWTSVDNVISHNDIDYWVHVMSKFNAVSTYDSFYKGIDENHVAFAWLNNVVFAKIKSVMPELPDNLGILFGMYLEENTPFRPHSDAYHAVPRNKKPAYSILVPISTDYDRSKVSNTSTVIFNEELVCYHQELEPLMYELPDLNVLDDEFCDRYLSHESRLLTRKLSLAGVFNWKFGSIVAWQAPLIHSSDNFIANGATSKQAIVLHTYYKD